MFGRPDRNMSLNTRTLRPITEATMSLDGQLPVPRVAVAAQDEGAAANPQAVGTQAIRLLVTGASGFIGARVVGLALERGHAVTAVVGPHSQMQRLAPVEREIELVRADITDRVALERVASTARPDVCVHLAAAGTVVCEDDLGALLAANAVAPALLAAELARAGCTRLVTTGSSSEYGAVEGAMKESSAPRPDDFYGVTKLAGGLLAGVVGARHGLETVHLRLFSVYGPGEDRRRLVASVVHALLADQPIALTPGQQVRDFVYVEDVAEAVLDAACVPALNRVTINIGSGRQTSVRELCGIVANLTGGHDLLRFSEVPYRPRERFSWRASTARAEHTLGWCAHTPLCEGLARTVEEARLERHAQVAV
jgi:nucleoside-diphosphate-sugar epimerase